MDFPTFRPKSKQTSEAKPVPPTPSFGLFLPTPIAASSHLASPYLSFSPAAFPAPPLPAPLQSAPQFGRYTLRNAAAAQPVSVVAAPAGVQPRYQLYEPLQAHHGTEVEAGWMTPMPPTPKPTRPLPSHPNPFGDEECTAFAVHTPPRVLPRLPAQTPRQSAYSAMPQPESSHKAQGLHPQPGQILTTSSTAYCRQITEMNRTRPLVITPSHRPTGPRRLDHPPVPPPISRGSSSTSSSQSSNATDLRRRSAVKSLPPNREYSSSSNKGNRLSLLSAISSRAPSPTHILPSHQLVESPPQADFIPDLADNATLSWQPERVEDDEARAVWRKMEERMGRRMHSGLEERGRWVVTPAASPMPPWTGGVEMSPGQFSVSDYMSFGEAYEPEQDQRTPRPEKVRGTPYPRGQPEAPTIRRSRRTKSRRVSPNSSRSSAPPVQQSVLDTLDDSLFPTFAAPPPQTKVPPPSNPTSQPKSVPQPKLIPQPKPQRNSLCRLDTHVISALEALKTDWASPDLDLALLGNSLTSSPLTPTPVERKSLSRPLPLPTLTRRSVSPTDVHLATPPPVPRPPLSPLERGLGLGMSITLGTTYNLPSKPTPALPSLPSPSRKNTRPLPSPVPVSRKSTGLSRKSTMRVEKVPEVEGVFVIRDLDTGEAVEVGVEGLEAALFEMASRA